MSRSGFRSVWMVGLVLLAALCGTPSQAASTAGRHPTKPFRYCAHADAVFKAPSRYVGISDFPIVAGSEHYRNCSLGLIAASGIGYFRWPLPWNDVELTPGQYDWAFVDQFVTDLARHHIRYLPILYGAPEWLSTAPAQGAEHGTYPPKNPDQFAQFAALAVERYGPHGVFWRDHPKLPYYPVEAWQIWNEETFAIDWEPIPSMRQFAQLLRATYPAIKRVDRHATVVVGGLPVVSRVTEVNFMSNLLRYGGKGFFDVFALHLYTLTVAQAIQQIWVARKVLNRFGDRRTPLWVTEFAWAGGGSDSFITNRQGQAANVRSFFSWIEKARSRLRLGKVFWYEWTNEPPGPGSSGDPSYWGYHMGLFTAQLQPKPAFAALAAWARRLDR